MKNLITLLFLAVFAFATLGILQALPDSVQTVVNQKATEMMPKKIAIVEAQNNYMDAAEKAAIR